MINPNPYEKMAQHTPRYVSADLLFQVQNAAIELAKKLGAAEARIAELEDYKQLSKTMLNQTFGKLGSTSNLYAGAPVCEHPINPFEEKRKVRAAPRDHGKSTLAGVIREAKLVGMLRNAHEMIEALTRPADPQGRGWIHPDLQCVQHCRDSVGVMKGELNRIVMEQGKAHV